MRRTFEPGVKEYRATYWRPGYTPDAEGDVVACFRVRPREGVPVEEAAAAVAAESSTGTWTEVYGQALVDLEALQGRVYGLDGDLVYIAYPASLVEPGSVPNLLSGFAGNVFGMKAVAGLRLEDLYLPPSLVRTFPGPSLGIKREREVLGVRDRPLLGGTVKPKLGLGPKEFAAVVEEALSGGLDSTKDDENLADQPFCPFRERVLRVQEAVERAEAATGEKKAHWFNVTGPDTEETLKRAAFAAEAGARAVMVDFVTLGWAGVASLRKLAGEKGLILHFHRAMHAAFTRPRDHGLDFRVLAKLARLAGADHLHVGTAVGKLEGSRDEVRERASLLRDDVTEPQGGVRFRQDWAGLAGTFPVASGGLHPGHLPQLLELLGVDSYLLFGGGTHGHPEGPRAGARAVRVGLEGLLDGKSLEESAESCPELARALEIWGGVRF